MATCLAYCPDRGLWKAIGHLKEQLKILTEQHEKDKRILPSNHQRMRLAAKAKQLTGRSTDEDRSCLRVLLADDHRIVREGLRSLLRGECDVEILGEAMRGREAVDLAMRLEPDVVIMDVSMPLIDGDVATRRIKEHLPKTRVIALSTYNDPEVIQKIYRAGAEGYILKTASSEELLAAIRGREPGSQKNIA